MTKEPFATSLTQIDISGLIEEDRCINSFCNLIPKDEEGKHFIEQRYRQRWDPQPPRQGNSEAKKS